MKKTAFACGRKPFFSVPEQDVCTCLILAEVDRCGAGEAKPDMQFAKCCEQFTKRAAGIPFFFAIL